MIYFIKGENSNMKKIALYAAVLSLLACSAFSCGSKNSSSSSEADVTDNTVETTLSPEEEYERGSEAVEDLNALFSDVEASAVRRAATDFYNSTFEGDLTGALSFIYPEVIVEKIEELDIYNEAAQSGIDIEGSSYKSESEYDVVIEKELNSDEIQRIEDYYNSFASSMDLGNYKCSISKGYELTVTLKDADGYDNTGTLFPDTAKAVYAEDEGWKIIKDEYLN